MPGDERGERVKIVVVFDPGDFICGVKIRGRILVLAEIVELGDSIAQLFAIDAGSLP